MSTQGLEAKVGRRIILASWDPQRNETEALEQELDEQKFLPGGDHFPLKCNLGPGGKGTEILAQCTPPPEGLEMQLRFWSNYPHLRWLFQFRQCFVTLK